MMFSMNVLVEYIIKIRPVRKFMDWPDGIYRIGFRLLDRYEVVVAFLYFAVFGSNKFRNRFYLYAVVDKGIFYMVECNDGCTIDRVTGAHVVENDVLAVGELPGRAFLDREFNIIEIDVFGGVDDEPDFCLHVDVVEREVLHWHLFDTADITYLFDFATGNVAQVYVAEHGSAFAYGFNFRGFIVEEIEDKGVALYVAHDDVVDTDLFYHTATSAGGFQPYTGIGTVEYAVGDGNPFYAARHFTADDYTAMTREHDTVGNGYVFAGFPVLATVGVAARLDGDAVIAYAHKAV